MRTSIDRQQLVKIFVVYIMALAASLAVGEGRTAKASAPGASVVNAEQP